MGGDAGIRGYYYQVLAGLLESVKEDSWESVEIEPSTKGDKVDIKWVFTDHIRAVQVKSSINNFERGDVIKWIYTLVKDARSDYAIFDLPITYTLYLIGTTDRNADKWISDLRGGRLEVGENDKLKEIEEELSNVEVTKQGFEQKNLEALAQIHMQEYLEQNGKRTTLENIKTLCSVIISELLAFTVRKKQMTKSLFLQLVNKHISSGEYGIAAITKAIPELALSFYEKGKVPEGDTMSGIRLDDTPLLNRFRTDAMRNLHKAQAIKLPMTKTEEATVVKDIDTNIEMPKELQELSGSMQMQMRELSDLGKKMGELGKKLSMQGTFPKNDYIPVKMPDEDIIELKELSHNLLGIVLKDEDFYFGGLEKRMFPVNLMFGGSENTPKGTKEEIAKYLAMEDAHASLLSYQCMLKYNEYLHTCHPLPIILKNTGAVADEGIQVTLKFPTTARLVTPQRMKAPFEPFIEDFIKENDVFDGLITPVRDHTVMEYEGVCFQMPVLPTLPMPWESVRYTHEDFAQHLAHLFNYEHFQEDGQDIVQYEFKALNPSCKMAFPTFLLVQSGTNMDIAYTITSKHLSKPIEGTLHWLHPIKQK